jgi:hypothetical protein
MPKGRVNIATRNACAENTDFHQNARALYVQRSSPAPVVKENGTIVVRVRSCCWDHVVNRLMKQQCGSAVLRFLPVIASN